MSLQLSVEKFLQQSAGQTIFDVRSPQEFAKGHIPGAINLPLFSDTERAEIGSLYKQKGSEKALLRGLEIVGPKMRAIVQNARGIVTGPVFVHCWRGGQRSASVTWLLEFSGFRCFLLAGGYKAFRQYIREAFGQEKKITILGGMTGCGKTEILQELRNLGEQIIDLENLAQHKGSAFGGIEIPQKRTQEQFENLLGLAWRQVEAHQNLWLEDESQRIGNLHIPLEIWQQMKKSPVLVLEMPAELRQQRLIKEYAGLDREALKTATNRIERRLGGLATKQVLAALGAGNMQLACEILLPYYDKFYQQGLSRRTENKVLRVQTTTMLARENARLLQSVYAENSAGMKLGI